MTNPGDIYEDLEHGIPFHDDGVRKRVIAPGPFVDIRDFGVKQNVSTDMTDEIQTAADACDENATLIIPQGTYYISDTIEFKRNINVHAYGVTFDLGTNVPTKTFSPGIPENYNAGYLAIAAREAGTLTNKAAVIWGNTGGSQIINYHLKGLRVTRTASAATAAARLYAGIVMHGLFDCTLEDVYATNFREGLVLTADSEGCAQNRIVRPHFIDCRYPMTFYAASSGWTNGNQTHDFRALTSSSISGDPSWDSREWELLRIMYATTTTNTPNQNSFYDANLETTCGRKLRLEGQDCLFMNCRWESLTDQSYDITIGEVSRANSFWAANTFVGRGSGLQNIYDDDRVEFLATFSNINNRNTFLTGDRFGFYGQLGNTTGFTSVASFAGTANDTPLCAFLDLTISPRIEKVIGYAGLPTSIQSGNFGGWSFQDSSSTVRNSLAMRSSSPWDLRTLAGLEIGSDLTVLGEAALPFSIGDLDFTLDGTVSVLLSNAQAGGKLYYKAQSTDRTFDLYNATSDANDVLRILDSGRDVKFVLKASESTFTGTTWGVIGWYEESTPGSPTLANGMFLTSLTMGGGTKPYPISVEKGFWINRQGGDFDSRVSGLTQTNLMYWDASMDRVGILKSNPAYPLDVGGDFRTTGLCRVDGSFDHNGTSIGVFGKSAVAQPSALTPAVTTITHTGPTTPDTDLATPSSGGWGFSTQDEFETTMSVIRNLQIRQGELEAGLDSTTGMGFFA